MFNLFRNTEKELEKARTKLISELNSGNIDFLLKQMGSKEIYSPLLKKKREKEISGTDDISWYAYRRAEELNHELDKLELIKKLSSNTENSIKKHIYFCLAHYCKNTDDQDLFNFLMDKLDNEKDTDCKLAILIGIREMEKSSNLNIEPIKKLVKKKTSLRVNAILALKNTHDDDVEDILLEIFEKTKDSHLKNMICSPLRSIGTKKSIPLLTETFKKTRDYGLRYSIDEIIQSINKKEL